MTQDASNEELLSDGELRQFLAELEEEDDILAEQEEQAKSQIANIDQLTEEDKKQNSSKEAREMQIRRQAFSQKKLDLTKRIPDEHFKILIGLLTQSHTTLIGNYRDYINKRLEKLLLRLMPACIRQCWKKYPDSMRACPGFFYEIKDKYRSYIFYATPKVPLYFDVYSSERSAIQAINPKAIETLDKAVKKYHTYTRNKSMREVHYASFLMRKNVKTYFDLLKLKPIMFEMLFNYLTNEA